MPSRSRNIESWETIVDGLSSIDCRHTLRKISRSPYIQVRSKNKSFQCSLKPLLKDNLNDIKIAANLCLFIGDEEWNTSVPITQLIKLSEEWDGEVTSRIYTWSEVRSITKDHLYKVMKESSMSNHLSNLNKLVESDIPFKFDSLKKWSGEYEVGSNQQYNRLNTLEVIRKALVNESKGDEPIWLRKQDLAPLRELYHQSKKRKKRYDRNSDMTDIRGIPTKKEAEEYLDSIALTYPLEQWIFAMLLCFGLRPHELWHIKPEDNKGQMWVYIPGQWRTKSKDEHWSWCLYPDWIDKYHLLDRFQQCQKLLHEKSKPKIMSSIDKTIQWNPDNKNNDLGVCVNNTTLGAWLNQRNRRQLPDWFASVPEINGENTKDAPQKRITAYDLRHTWAIRIATDKEWNHISNEKAAAAMGHDIDVHTKNYQRWISTESKKKTFMDSVEIK